MRLPRAPWDTLWRRDAPTSAVDRSGRAFVFVRIPEGLGPVDRGRKYEIPLDAALRNAGLGEVTGGGSMLATPGAGGGVEIEWVGLDVELVDLETGVPFVEAELTRLGAPPATTLEFERAGSKILERLDRANADGSDPSRR